MTDQRRDWQAVEILMDKGVPFIRWTVNTPQADIDAIIDAAWKFIFPLGVFPKGRRTGARRRQADRRRQAMKTTASQRTRDEAIIREAVQWA